MERRRETMLARDKRSHPTSNGDLLFGMQSAISEVTEMESHIVATVKRATTIAI